MHALNVPGCYFHRMWRRRQRPLPRWRSTTAVQQMAKASSPMGMRGMGMPRLKVASCQSTLSPSHPLRGASSLSAHPLPAHNAASAFGDKSWILVSSHTGHSIMRRACHVLPHSVNLWQGDHQGLLLRDACKLLTECALAACTRRYPTNAWTQYRVLQARAIKAYSRNPANVAGRTSMSIFLGIVGGLVFLNRSSGQSSASLCVAQQAVGACIVMAPP